MKVTFKKQSSPTGLAKIGASEHVAIKVKRRYCGYMASPSWSSKETGWVIRVMIEAPTPDKPRNWKWVTLKQRGADEADARRIAQEVIPRIDEKYTLHFDDDHEDY